MNAKSAVILAAAAATASAVTADQAKQLDIIFKDVGSNINQYINLVSDASSGITFDNLPSGLMDIGEEVATNPNDTSYTSKYDEVDLAGVSAFITKLSWYSDRLAPQLDAAGVPIGGEAKATTKAAETTTQAKATSKAAETTSAKAETTSKAASKAAETTSKAASKAAETTSKAASKATTVAQATKAQAISQIADGQIQATTATVAQQTENGAAKAVVGLGAGAIAAAALLL
ncbi:cold shock-induced protein Tir2p [Monosporozyma unispora]